MIWIAFGHPSLIPFANSVEPSLVTILIEGYFCNQLDTSCTVRFVGKVIGFRVCKSQTILPYRCPFFIAQSSIPIMVGSIADGISDFRARYKSLSALTGLPYWIEILLTASALSVKARCLRNEVRWFVCQAYGAHHVKFPFVKIRCEQAKLSQKNFLDRTCKSTGKDRMGISLMTHQYRLWIREEGFRQNGQ